jgi:hypothetical protein
MPVRVHARVPWQAYWSALARGRALARGLGGARPAVVPREEHVAAMRQLASRLQTLARQAGLCPHHETRPVCSPCESPGPLPEPLATMLDGLISAIVARVGTEGIRAAHLRVPPPPAPPPCRHCGGPRHCASCQEEYGKAIFGEIVLTAAEQATWEALLADCRARQRQRERG